MGYARRLHQVDDTGLESSSPVRLKQSHSHIEGLHDPLQTFGRLLLAFDPTAGWQLTGSRHGNGFDGKSPATRSATPTMSAEDQVKEQLEAQGRKDVQVRRGEITADGKKAFWKIGTGGSSAALNLLEYEAEGLARMADASNGMLAVPRPWIVGEVSTSMGGKSGYIVMDMLKQAGGNSDTQRQLGLGLAAMHSAPPPDDWEPDLFGFPLDGCCGAFSQPNNAERKKMNWIEFWAEYRLRHQLKNCDAEAKQMGQEIIDNLPKLFPFPIEEIKPSLLHGDLWSGNHAVDGNTGLPSLYDPACYYGHDEADFGIAHMFGGLSKTFYDAYFSVRPKKPGFEKRKILYELHHHLNHYNIFGGSYLGGAKSLMRELIRELKKD